jgi:membrane fusion protein (multidrug efflux system)
LRHIKVGRQVGPNWIVEEGLQPGDRVVVEGTLKARDGAVVNPEPMSATETNTSATNSSH